MYIEWEICTYGDCHCLSQVPEEATVTYIDNIAVVGRCESCLAWIMETEDYGMDVEGIYLCKNCHHEGEE